MMTGQTESSEKGTPFGVLHPDEDEDFSSVLNRALATFDDFPSGGSS